MITGEIIKPIFTKIFERIKGGLPAMPPLFAPIAWLFNTEGFGSEGDNTVVIDSVGDNIRSPVGSCYDFDGTDDFVVFGNEHNFNAQSFSASCWFKTTSSVTFRLWDKRGTGGFGSNIPGFQISAQAAWGNAAIDDGLGNYVRFDSVPYNEGDGEWHNLVMTWDTDSGTAKFWMDRVLKGTQVNPAMVNADLTTTRHLAFGCAWDAAGSQSQHFEGQAWDARLFDTALEQADIDKIYAFDPQVAGAILFCKFEETRGLFALDCAGSVNGDIMNIADESLFHVPNFLYSFADAVGYTDDPAYIIPRSEANTTLDANGGALQYPDRAKYSPKLVESACVFFHGPTTIAEAPADASHTNIFDGGGKVEVGIYPTSVVGGLGFSGFCRKPQSWRFLLTDPVGDDAKVLLIFPFDVTNGQYETTARAITVGNWYDLEITHDVDSISNVPILKINGNVEPLTIVQSPVGLRNDDTVKPIEMGNITALDKGFLGYMRDLKLYKQGVLKNHYPMSGQNNPDFLFDVESGAHLVPSNFTTLTQWSITQGSVHYNIQNGVSLYEHLTELPIIIPYDNAGLPISYTPPAGYTLTGDYPGGDGVFPKGVETKFRFYTSYGDLLPAAIYQINEMDGNEFLGNTATGDSYAIGYNDMVADVGGNILTDVTDPNHKKDFRIFEVVISITWDSVEITWDAVDITWDSV